MDVDIKTFDDGIDIFVAIVLKWFKYPNNRCLRLRQVTQVLSVDLFYSKHVSHPSEKRVA